MGAATLNLKDHKKWLSASHKPLECRSESRKYLKYPKYSRARHRMSRKQVHSQRQNRGKLLKSLWFLPIVFVKKLFRVQAGYDADINDEWV
jgi:hypothetical protein